MLTEALKCARRAVKHDSVEADMPAAIAAYDEAIAILQRVIARRSQKPGISSEVERVTSIVSRPSLSLQTRLGSLSTTIVFPAVLVFFSFFLFCSRFCSMTNMQIVYVNCVAFTEFACQAMLPPTAAGSPHR